jgi:GNAT superfamily N-acetyltransferase
MQDMLVRLYDLPPFEPGNWSNKSVKIKRAIAPELRLVCDWVYKEFGPGWESECRVAFTNTPISCFVAYEGNSLVGFACYDATTKNFFGPTGVKESHRGLGIGKALLLESMYALKAQGYAYAIIGGVGPVAFYQATLDAELIHKSNPGIYKDMLRSE